ncbi:MAG TPA: molybdenum cofactor guanylyltransferase [Cyclobacteriaceae bacterium]|jgi:molybdopterin-guanine dinucleotide biosynthesis protein A|nr:molybdenum cofactor guanylyltransferase [Cyclobacteriaceae bacterium]
MTSKINGLILAGGRSRRMGHDKSLITFHNKPQREYLFDLLNTLCDKVYTSCKKGDEVPSSLNPLPDQFEIESPINGILSAFSQNSTAAWLTVPVDMPEVNLEILNYLINNRSDNHIATCFFDSEGKNPEPLLTLWEPPAVSLLQKFYEAGNISPRDFLKQSNVNTLTIPDKRALRNINSPDDLTDFLSEKDHSS